MYRAIFIDIDGTLKNKQGNITQKTIETIKEVTKKGILVILCSGRPRKYTQNLSKQCGASKYVITSNGGNIYNYEEKETIYANVMNKKSCMELYKISEQVDAKFIMNTDENRVVNKLEYFDGSEVEVKTDMETFINRNDIVQCIISDTDFEKIKKLRPEIEKVKNVEIKNQHKSLIDENAKKEGSIYYDIANIDSSKGNAIRKFCETLNIDLKDTIAIGDDFNDISMFKVVGKGVAMGNANDKVKVFADEVTLSNEEDGVAIFLEKLINF